jgi:hypothetical protein
MDSGEPEEMQPTPADQHSVGQGDAVELADNGAPASRRRLGMHPRATSHLKVMDVLDEDRGD